MNITRLIKHATGAALVCMLASCTNESLESIDNDLMSDFTNAWLKRFGLVDKDQTWNMAEKVRINVASEVLGPDGTLYLYERDPATGAKSIARITVPGDYTVDIYRGTDKLYGRVYAALSSDFMELTYTLSDTPAKAKDTTSRAASSTVDGKYGRWLIAAEDLGIADDYDFNDVVIAIDNQTGDNVVKVTPMAAGGIYEVNVYYKDVFLFEAHQALGSARKKTGSYALINTSAYENTGRTYEVVVDDDFDITDNMGGFRIEVSVPDGKINTKTYNVNAPATGEVPQMILMPYEWRWPTESTRIDEAYPNFKKWNSDVANYNFWETKETQGRTVSHP